jgi:hypothetical protein
LNFRGIHRGILFFLPNVKGEPRDERREQTEKGGVIALALTTGSAARRSPTASFDSLRCESSRRENWRLLLYRSMRENQNALSSSSCRAAGPLCR